MNKPQATARWYTPWRQAGGAAAHEDDAADWGTAFGLEMSMPSVLPGAVEDPADPAAAPLGWFGRLTGRKANPAR